jgi:hypothetical protein
MTLAKISTIGDGVTTIETKTKRMKKIFTTKNNIQPMISHEQDDQQL